MDITTVPGHKTVIENIKAIDGNISVASGVQYTSDTMTYKFIVSKSNIECEILLDRKLLDDLNDYTGQKNSRYWLILSSCIS